MKYKVTECMDGKPRATVSGMGRNRKSKGGEMKNWTITVWQENPTGEPENWDWKAESDNGTLLYGYDCSTAERAKEEAKSEIRAHCI